jgi:C-terminal processing protease CtpA/Prc
VDGAPTAAWLAAREAEARDVHSFSTAQHAFFWTTHLGLSGPEGGRMELEVREPDGRKKKKNLSFDRRSFRTYGPAAMPADLRQAGDLQWGLLPSGCGYVHVRRCKDDLPERMDEALAGLAGAPGIVLDFRGNSGGGFDHDALFGRFIAQGKEISFNKRYVSAGPHPYAGPLVVIVDGSVVSAAETGSGMFKEDGRALLIGETATAGMSASKETIELPSGRFSLYVAVDSNMNRFNRGQGVEGIGVPPHLKIEFDPADLAAGRDTLIRRAEELLADAPARKGPWRDVPYQAGD